MSLFETLRRQPPWLVFIEALVLVASIGWVDYVTGWEWSFFIFYALPIFLVVRKVGRPLGFAFALLCAVTWCVAQIDSNPYVTEWGVRSRGGQPVSRRTHRDNQNAEVKQPAGTRPGANRNAR